MDMIDPHVHLRDWNQKDKETLKHGLAVAHKAGLDAVFEMPNTNPPLTSIEKIKERIKLADEAGVPIFHGIFGGVTSSPDQIKEIVKAYNELFPRVVGLKMFAGHSTGNMGLVEEDEQRFIYKTLAELDYRGIIFVHCEKEAFLKPDLWDPENPISHSLSRPPEAEVESVNDQIALAKEEGFKGTLHIAHISVPESVELIIAAKPEVDFKITCGITPHHALLYDELSIDTPFLKMNPPLRSKAMQEEMLKALFDGMIDWIETDHAPHTLEEKKKKFPSGIPGFPFYPHFIKLLREKGMPEQEIEDLTHNNIAKAFNIDIKNEKREPDYNLEKEYGFSAFK